MRLADLGCRCGHRSRNEAFDSRVSLLTLRRKCPSCGKRTLVWIPSFGSADAREPFYDPFTGNKFTSFHEKEKWDNANGKTTVSRKEFEVNHLGKNDPERLIEDRWKRDPKRREVVEKTVYRALHGYRD
jgi:hypothetical protein